jgi:hypothetical protein
MNLPTIDIHSFADLAVALANSGPCNLQLQSSVLCPSPITLPPGFVLSGKNKERCILSFSNGDGVGLTADNRVEKLTLMTTPSCRAIYLQGGFDDMGNIELSELAITGQVSLIVRAGTTHLNLGVDDIHIAACDSRHYSEQPQKYGVNVYQGALTVYNFNSDAKSEISAALANISIGNRGAPVIGSGIFISGSGDDGGTVTLDELTTGAVYSNGMLPSGTADIITGGVFIANGVNAKLVEHLGEIVTYGVNDMVLDAWGAVESWIAHAPLVSYGPSGIGFVNFGAVGNFVAERELVTYGAGARGFNQYDGSVKCASFHSIETFGDGSVGIQVSRPVGIISVKNSVTTHGSVGSTLVKGVNVSLAADAISVKPGGAIDRLEVGGDLATFGSDVTTFAVEGGAVKALEITGHVLARGMKSNAIFVGESGSTPLTNVRASATAGKSLVINDGRITDRTGFTA